MKTIKICAIILSILAGIIAVGFTAVKLTDRNVSSLRDISSLFTQTEISETGGYRYSQFANDFVERFGISNQSIRTQTDRAFGRRWESLLRDIANVYIVALQEELKKGFFDWDNFLKSFEEFLINELADLVDLKPTLSGETRADFIIKANELADAF